jgi:transketolase
MRAAFIRALVDLAERDSRILLLTGDLGFTVVEPFADRYPQRFFNIGVAEQNMVGVATGLAEAGFVPFVYSIATFASMRAFEFIRNGPIAHQLPVRIVGIGGGFDYASAGMTHFALEDIGLMRTQPGLRAFVAADHAQATTMLHATWDLPGPIYYRLGKDDRTLVPGLDGQFEIGRLQSVREGDDLLFVALGGLANQAVAAAAALEQRGVRCGVAIIASVNPPPADDLAAALQGVPLALTVEAHYVSGGVGSLVAEVVAERGIACRVVRCGVTQLPDGVTGDERFLLERHGLTCESLVDRALAALV